MRRSSERDGTSHEGGREQARAHLDVVVGDRVEELLEEHRARGGDGGALVDEGARAALSGLGVLEADDRGRAVQRHREELRVRRALVVHKHPDGVLGRVEELVA
jgi:hypothetical protein